MLFFKEPPINVPCCSSSTISKLPKVSNSARTEVTSNKQINYIYYNYILTRDLMRGKEKQHKWHWMAQQRKLERPPVQILGQAKRAGLRQGRDGGQWNQFRCFWYGKGCPGFPFLWHIKKERDASNSTFKVKVKLIH